MKLKPRLQVIASLVDKGAILVDIGCDHGYLVIYLVLNDIIKKGYASDVNQGPLDNVKSNLKKYGVLNITTHLSNGLQDIKFNDYDTVVVAGMGGSLIVDILNEGIDKIKDKTLILQPNINSYKLRKFLNDNNMDISIETLVKENDIIYDIIKVQGSTNDRLSELELMYGKLNLEKRDSLLIEKMRNDLEKNFELLKQIPNDNLEYEKRVTVNNLIKEYLNEVS